MGMILVTIALFDHRLGTNKDFIDVCDALHGNGIRIVLDGVFNHVGRNFWAFKMYSREKKHLHTVTGFLI